MWLVEFAKISTIYIKIGLHKWITLDIALKIYIYYKSYILQKLYFTIALLKRYDCYIAVSINSM